MKPITKIEEMIPDNKKELVDFAKRIDFTVKKDIIRSNK